MIGGMMVIVWVDTIYYYCSHILSRDTDYAQFFISWSIKTNSIFQVFIYLFLYEIYYFNYDITQVFTKLYFLMGSDFR